MQLLLRIEESALDIIVDISSRHVSGQVNRSADTFAVMPSVVGPITPDHCGIVHPVGLSELLASSI